MPDSKGRIAAIEDYRRRRASNPSSFPTLSDEAYADYRRRRALATADNRGDFAVLPDDAYAGQPLPDPGPGKMWASASGYANRINDPGFGTGQSGGPDLMPQPSAAQSPFALNNAASAAAPQQQAPAAASPSSFPSGGIFIYGPQGGREGEPMRVVTNEAFRQGAAPGTTAYRQRVMQQIASMGSLPDGGRIRVDTPPPPGTINVGGANMNPAQLVNSLRGIEEDSAMGATRYEQAKAGIRAAAQSPGGYDLGAFGLSPERADLLSSDRIARRPDGRPEFIAPSGKSYLDEGDVVAAYARRDITRSEFEQDLAAVREYTLAVRDQGQALRLAAEQGSAAYNSLPYDQARAMQMEHERRLAATPLQGSPRSNEYYRQKADQYTAPITKGERVQQYLGPDSDFQRVIREYDDLMSGADWDAMTPYQRMQIRADRAGTISQYATQMRAQAARDREQGIITEQQERRIAAAANMREAQEERAAKRDATSFSRWFATEVRNTISDYKSGFKGNEAESEYYDSKRGGWDSARLKRWAEDQVRSAYQAAPQPNGNMLSSEDAPGPSPFAVAGDEFSRELAP